MRAITAMTVVMMVMTSTPYFCFLLLSHIVFETEFVNNLSYDKTNKSKNSHIERRQCIDFNGYTTNNYRNDNQQNCVLISWFPFSFNVNCSHESSVVFVFAKLQVLCLLYKFSGKRIYLLHSTTEHNWAEKGQKSTKHH